MIERMSALELYEWLAFYTIERAGPKTETKEQTAEEIFACFPVTE